MAATESSAAGGGAVGSDIGEAIWRALSLLFHKRGTPVSIAALAALAALATCDGSCARAGGAGLPAAASYAADWGVYHPEDRQVCAEALQAGFLKDAAPRPALRGGRSTAAGGCSSCRRRLLCQLFEQGLTPRAVLPAYNGGAHVATHLNDMFFAARGDKYNVSCVCVALERPSARHAYNCRVGNHTRELERRVGGHRMSAGDHLINLSTRLPQGDGGDDVTVTLQAAFQSKKEASGGRDERDVYLLVTPYTPHDGEPHFPNERLQALLRTPPPEWEGHPLIDNDQGGGFYIPESTFARRLPGGTGGGVKVALAELVMPERAAMVWLFTAVKARDCRRL